MTYPKDVPALMTITDFAKRCGVSRVTAAKIAVAHPEFTERVEGGQMYVKAGLLFSFYDTSGAFVELNSTAKEAANASLVG